MDVTMACPDSPGDQSGRDWVCKGWATVDSAQRCQTAAAALAPQTHVSASCSGCLASMVSFTNASVRLLSHRHIHFRACSAAVWRENGGGSAASKSGAASLPDSCGQFHTHFGYASMSSFNLNYNYPPCQKESLVTTLTPHHRVQHLHPSIATPSYQSNIHPSNAISPPLPSPLSRTPSP